MTLSFYVFDWDGTNIIDDDFLGSAFCSMSEVITRHMYFVSKFNFIVSIVNSYLY